MLKKITVGEALELLPKGAKLFRVNKITRETNAIDLAFADFILADVPEEPKAVETPEGPKETVSAETIDKLEKAVKAPTKKRGGRKPLDTGKVMALHKAGWSKVKIADEMGVSDTTISNALKKMGV